MNATLKNLTLAATAVALAAVLSACTAVPVDENPTPTVAATVAPDETPAAPPVEGPVATVESVALLATGDPLTVEQVEALDGERKSGMVAYELAEDQFVLVKKDEPLPAPVQAAEDAKLATAGLPTSGAIEEQAETIQKLPGLAGSAGFATGKRACVVAYATYANTGGPGADPKWVTAGCPLIGREVPSGFDKEAVIAAARDAIATADNPAEWALIIQP